MPDTMVQTDEQPQQERAPNIIPQHDGVSYLDLIYLVVVVVFTLAVLFWAGSPNCSLALSLVKVHLSLCPGLGGLLLIYGAGVESTRGCSNDLTSDNTLQPGDGLLRLTRTETPKCKI